MTGDDAYSAELADAAAWLAASNLACAREWALGEERTFEADQEAGTLSLLFRDKKRMVLPMQILASFVPRERDTRWAWANPSVRPELAAAAAGLRQYGQERGFAALTEPSPELTFNALAALAALAARRFGCLGVYRCLRADHSTVFVGFGSGGLQGKDGQALPVERLWRKPRPADGFESAALRLVEAWDAECYPVDAAYQRRTGRTGEADVDALERAVAEKEAIFDRYWRPRNDLWRPNSTSWPSDHDPHSPWPTAVIPRRAGGCWVVRLHEPHRQTVYVVEELEGSPKITDIDPDWGRGLIWVEPDARPPAQRRPSLWNRLGFRGIGPRNPGSL